MSRPPSRPISSFFFPFFLSRFYFRQKGREAPSFFSSWPARVTTEWTARPPDFSPGRRSIGKYSYITVRGGGTWANKTRTRWKEVETTTGGGGCERHALSTNSCAILAILLEKEYYSFLRFIRSKHG